MGDKTKIEYCDATWNPVKGCSKVSPGCKNCWAERMAARFSRPGEHFHGLTKDGRWDGSVSLYKKELNKPFHWTRPRRIAVCLMGDLFHEAVPWGWIDDVFHVMRTAPQHIYMVLTKRASRMSVYAARYLQAFGEIPKNIWFGISAENQETFDDRIGHLLSIPLANVVFVSAEPLLGPIKIEPAIDLMIVGGESKTGARPMEASWAVDIRDQCKKAGVKFFFKQGSSANWTNYKDFESFPEELQVRELP